MKILYGSDIHLEFQKHKNHNPQIDECDLLLLAGDIFTPWDMNTTDKGIFNSFFDEVSDKAKQTLMVMGNHEHYHGIFNKTAQVITDKLAKYSNIRLLDNDVFVYEGVGVFGSTFWTDARNNHPEVAWDIQRAMADYEHVKTKVDRYDPLNPGVSKSSRLRVEDTVQENHASRAALAAFLAVEGRKIVLTHMAPSFDHCIHDYQKSKNVSYAYANTNMDGFFEQEYQWVYGHTHDRMSSGVDNVSFHTNARGYHGMEVVHDFRFKELE